MSCVCFLAFICVCLIMSNFFATPWTVAHQASLSMEVFRQEYLSGLPCPPPGDLPNPGIKLRSPALQVDSLLSEPPGKPWCLMINICRIVKGKPSILSTVLRNSEPRARFQIPVDIPAAGTVTNANVTRQLPSHALGSPARLLTLCFYFTHCLT